MFSRPLRPGYTQIRPRRAPQIHSSGRRPSATEPLPALGRFKHELQRATEIPRHPSHLSAAPQLGALFPGRLVRWRSARPASAKGCLPRSALAPEGLSTSAAKFRIPSGEPGFRSEMAYLGVNAPSCDMSHVASRLFAFSLQTPACRCPDWRTQRPSQAAKLPGVGAARVHSLARDPASLSSGEVVCSGTKIVR